MISQKADDYLTPQPQRSIRTSRHTPRLPRMPVQTHNTQPALDLVSAQYLQWNDSRVLHKITNDFSVENLDGAVVGGIGEEGETALVEAHGTNGFLVETQGLVGFVG